jgi:dienelactone hydrolase
MLRFAAAAMVATLLLSGCVTGASIRIERGFRGLQPATLNGELFLPKTPGPHPAVIVAHGCSGITAGQRGWAHRIADWGYATLLLDSLATRGLSSVCLDASLLTGAARAPDIAAAARWLRARPDIDADRIGMIGFSHGGWTGVWTAHPRWASDTRTEPLRAVVTVYPWCDTLSGINAPLLVLIGDADDWTPAERCRWLQHALGAREDAEFVFYPGARHGFDVPGLNSTVQGFSGGVVATRWLLGDPAAARDAERRVKAWFDRHLAPRRG